MNEPVYCAVNNITHILPVERFGWTDDEPTTPYEFHDCERIKRLSDIRLLIIIASIHSIGGVFFSRGACKTDFEFQVNRFGI